MIFSVYVGISARMTSASLSSTGSHHAFCYPETISNCNGHGKQQAGLQPDIQLTKASWCRLVAHPSLLPQPRPKHCSDGGVHIDKLTEEADRCSISPSLPQTRRPLLKPAMWHMQTHTKKVNSKSNVCIY